MSIPNWHRLPALSALRAFECAARMGSFAAAARALNVTPPAVAQQVRALESHLGLPLFRRSGRGQVLTAAGADFARRLGAGFSALAEAVDAVRRTDAAHGIRVTTTPAFARNGLLPRLQRFWDECPGITVSIHSGVDVVDLAAQGFDLAIRSGAGSWPGVVAERLIDSRLTLVVAPRLIAGGKPLDRLPWLLNPRDPVERGWLTGAGFDPDSLPTHDLEDAGLAVEAAIAGYGLIFATREIVATALDEGKLVEVPFPGLPVTSYWIATPPGPRSDAVERFIAWLHRDMVGHRSPLDPVLQEPTSATT